MQKASTSVGWIGTGRMGFAMAERLALAGYETAVWNRTRAKAEPLTAAGARVVDKVSDLAGSDVVFTMVAASADLREVMLGPGGLLSGGDRVPSVIVDCSTVSAEVSLEVRTAAAELGCALLCAPVSGSGKVAAAGLLTMVVSGPPEAYATARPLLTTAAREVTYVGEGEVARVVKLCHNLFLGAVTQSLAEVTVLAEKAGVRRSDFLAFLNGSVLGSVFTRYKTPALVNLDFTPSFTSVLLRKDFDLGLAAARELETPMPVAALVHQRVQASVGQGYDEMDFATLLELQAADAGLTLEPENVPVDDGLSEGPR